MTRIKKNYISLFFKGMLMGASDVVPGVSGGTIAFITGIYEELIQIIGSLNFSLLKVWKEKGFSTFWKAINGNFLLALGSGVGLSIFTMAKGISWLLENHPIALWSFFFGLVLASIIYVGKQVKKWNGITILGIISSSIIAYYITITPALNSANHSELYLFLSGALAICAMILPGISGAFILVLLGSYKTILNAAHEWDFKTIFIVMLGALVGILSFSKLLKWLYAKYKNFTLAFLTGFMIGSLNKIWPWKKVLSFITDSEGVQIPVLEKSILPNHFEADPKLGLAITLMIVGFVLVFILEKMSVKGTAGNE